ncbi:MAG: type II secretion system minor pseudopilin GspK [Proteobacteria bacterium]|nr:type II secretion system minor pseudopilin GspK [Pseudomonadota bacterium]
MSAPLRARRRRGPPRRQRGVALLVAVLLVALGTIIAAAVAYENAMTARRGAATYAFDQSVLIAQGAEALAAYGVRQLVQQDAKHYVYLGQGWDKPYGPMEIVPGVMLTAYLEDLQGRFNVNNLVDATGRVNATQLATFKALLAAVGLEEKWAGLLTDWIDADTVPGIPDGAEDSTYLGQTPPYLTANRYITSTSELMALPGFDRAHYNLIAPYIVALPHGTRLNTCTASGVVLDAYIGAGHVEFGGTNADTLTRNRANAGGCFPTVQDYAKSFTAGGNPWTTPAAPGATGTRTGIAQTPTGGLNAGGAAGNGPGAPVAQGVQALVGQNTNYFRLTSDITIGSTEFNLYSLLYMDTGYAVRPIQRSFTPD